MGFSGSERGPCGLTAVEDDGLDAGLLAQLVDDGARLVERLRGQVDGGGDGAALPVGAAHVDEQEAPVAVGAERGVALEQLHHVGGLEAVAAGLGFGEGRPPRRRRCLFLASGLLLLLLLRGSSAAGAII